MRRKSFIIGVVLLPCVVGFFLFSSSEKSSGILVDGQPIEHWEELALRDLPQGNDAAVTKVIAKMGPETVPFWLSRLQAHDSGVARVYQEAWEMAPASIQRVLPVSVPQEIRRNVAYFHLSKLPCTNGIPELIRLSRSADEEVQYYAVALLGYLAYTGFFEPSSASTDVFSYAARTGNEPTRSQALQALLRPPLRTDVLPTLYLATNDTNELVRITAAAGLVRFNLGADYRPMLEAGLKSPNVAVVRLSQSALEQLRKVK